MEYLLYAFIAYIIIDLIKWSVFMASVQEINDAILVVSNQLVEVDGKVDAVLAGSIQPSDLDGALAAINGLGAQVAAINVKLS
jgi:hypothetical protein